jgi:hypothetical protein
MREKLNDPNNWAILFSEHDREQHFSIKEVVIERERVRGLSCGKLLKPIR